MRKWNKRIGADSGVVDLGDIGSGILEVVRRQHAADLAVMRSTVARKSLDRVGKQASENAVQRDHVYRGTFRDGFLTLQTAEGRDLVNDAPHAGELEAGRDAGLPVSEDAIREWASVKLVARGQLDPGDLDRFAHNVANKIERDGLPPRFLVADALEGFGDIIADEAARALPAKMRA